MRPAHSSLPHLALHQLRASCTGVNTWAHSSHIERSSRMLRIFPGKASRTAPRHPMMTAHAEKQGCCAFFAFATPFVHSCAGVERNSLSSQDQDRKRKQVPRPPAKRAPPVDHATRVAPRPLCAPISSSMPHPTTPRAPASWLAPRAMIGCPQAAVLPPPLKVNCQGQGGYVV